MYIMYETNRLSVYANQMIKIPCNNEHMVATQKSYRSKYFLFKEPTANAPKALNRVSKATTAPLYKLF